MFAINPIGSEGQGDGAIGQCQLVAMLDLDVAILAVEVDFTVESQQGALG